MKVSVIIPAYNHEKYISETINSVLHQTFDDFELIIINDGSKDKTEDVIVSFYDKRVKYFYQENEGAHVAINRGIGMAAGEYISILNSDDVYSPERLRRCVDFLDYNQGYDAVITKVSGINGKSLAVSKRDSAHSKAWMNWYEEALTFFENEEFMPNSFSKNILITTSNYFIRKKTLDSVGGFLPLRYAHDWDMLLKLSGESRIHLMDEVLLKYRIHDSNTIQEGNSEQKVKFEVNWLVAENFDYLLSSGVAFAKIFDLLKENHYLSIDVLMLLLAYRKKNPSLPLLDFEHPVTKRLIQLLS